MTKPELLKHLAGMADRKRVHEHAIAMLEQDIDDTITALLTSGATWSEIGGASGVDRGTVHRTYYRRRRDTA